MRTAGYTLLMLFCYAASGCASTPPPRQQKVWILSLQAADSDVFCMEPTELGEAWPQPCRTVGEVRQFLQSLRAD